MAKCDEGYLCDVCGQDVAELTDSDLYLRYIVGMLDPEVLHTTPERHIRCNPRSPSTSSPTTSSRSSSKARSTSARSTRATSREREALLTRGWRRLNEVVRLGVPIIEYPLPEVLAAIKAARHSRQ